MQPTSEFLPGESQGQRSLTGLQSTGSHRVRHAELLTHLMSFININMVFVTIHVLINQFLPSYQSRTKPSLFEQDLTYLKISHDHSITELELLS